MAGGVSPAQLASSAVNIHFSELFFQTPPLCLRKTAPCFAAKRESLSLSSTVLMCSAGAFKSPGGSAKWGLHVERQHRYFPHHLRTHSCLLPYLTCLSSCFSPVASTLPCRSSSNDVIPPLLLYLLLPLLPCLPCLSSPASPASPNRLRGTCYNQL